MKWILNWFRLVGLLEGTSFLLLLFIAMPLKYWADMPIAVTVVGGAHGGLFVAYVLLATIATFLFRWPISRLFIAVAASLLPGGTFWFDRTLRELQSQSKE